MSELKENTEIIRAYYDDDPLYEWERTDERTIEYIVTTRMFCRYINPGESVLDIGGGPGRYSTWLASRG